MKPASKSKYHLPRIVIQTLTWSRDSNGLFDYESKNLAKKSFVARRTSQLVRIENDVLLKEDDFQIGPEATGLAWVVEGEGMTNVGGFSVKSYQTSDQLWMVVPPVRSLKPSDGYPMSEGDVLRLGRVSFSVKQVCPTGKDNPAFAFKAPQDVSIMPVEASPKTEKMPCRICLSDSQTLEDPLISPCKCAGTMKFIHLKCLREWLQSRLNIKQSGSIVSYYWKSLDCELCKENLPSTVMLGGNLVELVDIHKPDTPFIVLEDITRERDRVAGLGIHVLSMPPGAVINIVSLMLGSGT